MERLAAAHLWQVHVIGETEFSETAVVVDLVPLELPFASPLSVFLLQLWHSSKLLPLVALHFQQFQVDTDIVRPLWLCASTATVYLASMALASMALCDCCCCRVDVVCCCRAVLDDLALVREV